MKKIPVTIVRHHKERISKCSLQPLYGKVGFTFIKWKPGVQLDATGYLLLAVDAPELTEQDCFDQLLLLDSTWRLLDDLDSCILGTPIRRSLPKWIQTAYPRVSKIGDNPVGGLASIEAIYAAKKILGDDDPTLLDSYYWKEQFLKQFQRYC